MGAKLLLLQFPCPGLALVHSSECVRSSGDRQQPVLKGSHLLSSIGLYLSTAVGNCYLPSC